MTLLYWNIGKDITDNVLNNQKAEYGKAVIKKLSQKLTIEYGRGYSRANLFRMLKFYEYWSVRTLRERIGSALFERTAISKKL